MSNLTEKQKLFADYYIESLNATQSYAKAYDNDKQKTCEVRGSQLLSNTKVSEYINDRIKEAKNDRIASISDIMVFWSDVMNNEYEKLGYNKSLYVKDRQTASDSLMKRLELSDGKDDIVKIKIVKASEQDG